MAEKESRRKRTGPTLKKKRKGLLEKAAFRKKKTVNRKTQASETLAWSKEIPGPIVHAKKGNPAKGKARP